MIEYNLSTVLVTLVIIT